MTTNQAPLTPELLHNIDAYWRAANYLSVGQIYLYDNPLLNQALTLAHIKPRLLGHWGTTPGLNFIYVHLNRVIKERDLSIIYIAGPGHGEIERPCGRPTRLTSGRPAKERHDGENRSRRKGFGQHDAREVGRGQM